MQNLSERIDKTINNKVSTKGVSIRILSIPLLIVELFFGLTLVLYFFGPTKFEKDNSFFLLFILTLYHLVFILGYFIEIKKNKYDQIVEKKIYKNPQIQKRRILRFIKIIIVFGLILTTISTVTYTNITSLSPFYLIKQIAYSLNNPLGAYSESFGINNGGFIFKLLVIFAPVSWAAFPLSVAFFKKLPITYKILTLIMFLLEAIRWIVMGRNKGVFDLAIIVSVIVLMKFLQNQYTQKSNIEIKILGYKKNKAKSRKSLIVILVLVFSAISYFTNAIGSRTQYYRYDSSLYDTLLMKISPEILHPTLIYLTNYLTQGYRAFSKIIEVDWTPMFGIGNSMFLIANFSGLFGRDFFQYTYQTKLISQGIDPFVAWHTFYTWIANDVHWIGVIVIMFLLGKYFAFIVKRNIIYGEIITYPLICLMFIIMFYMSGNNQVFSQSNTFITFWFLSSYWLLIRKKIVFTKSVYGLFEKNIEKSSLTK